MTEFINPDIWESISDPDNPNIPSFRFSRYFTETSDKVTTKIAGEWIKTLDTDTINDLHNTLRKIDEECLNDNIDENNDVYRDLMDFLYLTVLIWQWETGRTWDINIADDDKHHLHVEYQFRLSSLIQFEHLQRHGGKSRNERLERDNAQYNGRLSIFD